MSEDVLEADGIQVEEVPPVKMGPLRSVAILVSYVFHPLLLSVYAFLFINAGYPFLFAHLDKVEKMRLFLTIATNTIAFPLITILIMRQLGFANSMQLRTQRERILPYIAMSLFYFWTFMVIRSLSIGDLFNHVILGASLSVFMAFFFNNFFKISIHAVGAGSFVAIALVLTMISNYNLVPLLLLIILLAGLVGSSRLYLGVHSSKDIYTGYMVGILAQLIAFRFF